MQAYQRVDLKLRDEAIAQAEAALRLDQRCGRAWSTLAFAYWQHANFRTCLDLGGGYRARDRRRSRALEIDREDYMAQVYRGAALTIGQRFDEALNDMREAWRINPMTSHADRAGLGEISFGYTAAGSQRLREALRLSPATPSSTISIPACVAPSSSTPTMPAASNGAFWASSSSRTTLRSTTSP